VTRVRGDIGDLATAEAVITQGFTGVRPEHHHQPGQPGELEHSLDLSVLVKQSIEDDLISRYQVSRLN